MDFFSEKMAERLGGKTFGNEAQIYKFEKIKRAKKDAKERNPEIPLIDMGVGEPDKPADKSIVDILAYEAGRPEGRRIGGIQITVYRSFRKRLLYTWRILTILRGLTPMKILFMV